MIYTKFSKNTKKISGYLVVVPYVYPMFFIKEKNSHI